MTDPLSQINSRIAQILAEIESRKAELADLEVAKRVFAKLNNLPQPQEKVLSRMVAGPPRRWQSEKNALLEHNASVLHALIKADVKTSTIKEIVMTVLWKNPDPWMIASDIQDMASKVRGSEIPMSTLSPTLTALKDEGLIVRDGQKVAHARRVSGEGLV